MSGVWGSGSTRTLEVPTAQMVRVTIRGRWDRPGCLLPHVAHLLWFHVLRPCVVSFIEREGAKAEKATERQRDRERRRGRERERQSERGNKARQSNHTAFGRVAPNRIICQVRGFFVLVCAKDTYKYLSWHPGQHRCSNWKLRGSAHSTRPNLGLYH